MIQQFHNRNLVLVLVFVDITKFQSKKLSALNAYELEMREFPHSRSVENAINLMRYRGASVGLEAAEAYMVIRSIIR